MKQLINYGLLLHLVRAGCFCELAGVVAVAVAAAVVLGPAAAAVVAAAAERRRSCPSGFVWAPLGGLGRHLEEVRSHPLLLLRRRPLWLPVTLGQRQCNRRSAVETPWIALLVQVGP